MIEDAFLYVIRAGGFSTEEDTGSLFLIMQAGGVPFSEQLLHCCVQCIETGPIEKVAQRVAVVGCWLDLCRAWSAFRPELGFEVHRAFCTACRRCVEHAEEEQLAQLRNTLDKWTQQAVFAHGVLNSMRFAANQDIASKMSLQDRIDRTGKVSMMRVVDELYFSPKKRLPKPAKCLTNRGWYPSSSTWLRIFKQAEHVAPAAPAKKPRLRKEEPVTMEQHPTGICFESREKFHKEWHDEIQAYVYRDAVRRGDGKIVHRSLAP